MRQMKGYMLATSRRPWGFAPIGRLGLSIVLGASVLGFGESQVKEHRLATQPGRSLPEVRTVIDLAYMAPPEFGADALLRLVEAGLISDAEQKLELLRDAFQMALQAPEAVKYAYTAGFAGDSRESELWLGYSLNVDRESLRCRAVQQMLLLDRSRARRWFDEIGLPKPPAHDCGSTIAYDPETFYQTLGLLVRKGFSEEERAKEEHIEFAERYLKALVSPAQVVPAAGMLATLDLPPRQFDQLLRGFSAALVRIPPDSRAFRDGRRLIDAMRPLAEKCRSADIPCDGLVAAVREYVRRNMSAVRCADSVERQVRAASFRPKSIQKAIWPAVDEQFDSWSARKPPYVREEIPPLSPEEIKPEKIGPAPEIHKFWTGPTASRLLDGIRRLRFKRLSPPAGGKPERYTIDERRRHQWTSQFLEFLENLESWKGDDEPDEVDFILQKLMLYGGLAELAPPGELRDRMLESYIALLRGFLDRRPDLRAVGVARAEVLLQRLERSRLTAVAARNEQYQDVDWALRALERSGSPLLTLFAKLDRLTNPRSRPRNP